MAGAVPPDAYAGNYDGVKHALATMLAVPCATIGHFATLTEVVSGKDGWHVTACCEWTTAHLPELLRAMADQCDDRARRLSQ